MLIDLTTVTADEVISAYEAKNLFPVFGEWGDGVTCACAITAIAAARLNEQEYNSFLEHTDCADNVAAYLKVSPFNVLSFIHGFDNNEEHEDDVELFGNGYAVRQKVMEHFSIIDQ